MTIKRILWLTSAAGGHRCRRLLLQLHPQDGLRGHAAGGDGDAAAVDDDAVGGAAVAVLWPLGVAAAGARGRGVVDDGGVRRRPRPSHGLPRRLSQDRSDHIF